MSGSTPAPAKGNAPGTAGSAVPYARYRAHFEPRAGMPVHWSWPAIASALDAAPPAERGSLTLSADGTPGGCEMLPGMAINVQQVPAGGSTRAHAHAWWHLFFVRSGSALAFVGRDDGRRLGPGDLLLVPAWNHHRFDNDSTEDLVMLSMSNLPQQASLANHLAIEPEEAGIEAPAHGVQPRGTVACP